jgi:hypothetical protein
MLLISFVFFTIDSADGNVKNVVPDETNKTEDKPMKKLLGKIVKNALKSVLSTLSNVGAGIVAGLLLLVDGLPQHYR